MTSADTYTCRWCRNAMQLAGETSCRFCGAPVDVREATSSGGWTELPAIEDMARLQFAQSYCQIEGAYVPVADFNLAQGESVYFAHHLLLWKDSSVKVSVMSLGGAWKRVWAGLPLVMTEAHGPGHAAFSRDVPGEVVALPLQPGQAVDVREHQFMVATGQVRYSWFNSNVWFQTQNGDDTETHHPLGQFMDRFGAQQQPGLLLLHAGGNSFERTLAAGETILVKPTSLLFKDATVAMQLHFEYPNAGVWRPWRSWGNRYLLLRLFGPGRVAVMSGNEHFHDPGTNVVRCSPATQRQW
jgi:uncharacterized protein (AIM24 family)